MEDNDNLPIKDLIKSEIIEEQEKKKEEQKKSNEKDKYNAKKEGKKSREKEMIKKDRKNSGGMNFINIEIDRINEILEEKENIFLQDSENNIHNTSIIFQKDTSFNNIGLNDNNIDKDVGLNSMLNPPKEFVKDLLDEDEKFFKQMSEKEYYDGLTQYKDQLYRDFIQKFLKNN